MKIGMLQKIHDQLESELSKEGAYLDEIAFCSHKPKEGCEYRKPNPGMLLKLASKHNIDLAGRTAGTSTVKIGSPDLNADINAH